MYTMKEKDRDNVCKKNEINKMEVKGGVNEKGIRKIEKNRRR